MNWRSAYLRALETVVHGAGLPYGYAVTVSSTTAALTRARGSPSVGSIFLFALGAVAAYGGVRLLTWGTEEEEAERPLTRSPKVLRAGFFHVTAIGLAIGSAMLIAQLHSVVAWLLAPLAATLLYLGIPSVEIAFLERGREATTGASGGG
jgi:hypothetical protein